MPRMDYEDDRKKITFRVSQETFEQFDQKVENGEIDNKSAKLREVLREHVLDEDVEEGYLPDDDKLRKAYLALEEHATKNDDGSLWIDADSARTLVAQVLNTKKDLVKRLYLYPLEEKGYLRAVMGRIEVKPKQVPVKEELL